MIGTDHAPADRPERTQAEIEAKRNRGRIRALGHLIAEQARSEVDVDTDCLTIDTVAARIEKVCGKLARTAERLHDPGLGPEVLDCAMEILLFGGPGRRDDPHIRQSAYYFWPGDPVGPRQGCLVDDILNKAFREVDNAFYGERREPLDLTVFSLEAIEARRPDAEAVAARLFADPLPDYVHLTREELEWRLDIVCFCSFLSSGRHLTKAVMKAVSGWPE